MFHEFNPLFFGPVKREGHESGYQGCLSSACPYRSNQMLKQEWLLGWRLGNENRRLDFSTGRHPELAMKEQA